MNREKKLYGWNKTKSKNVCMKLKKIVDHSPKNEKKCKINGTVQNNNCKMSGTKRVQF